MTLTAATGIRRSRFPSSNLILSRSSSASGVMHGAKIYEKGTFLQVNIGDVFQKLVDGDMRKVALLRAFFDVSAHSSRVWQHDTRNLPAVGRECGGLGSAGGSVAGASERGGSGRSALVGSGLEYRSFSLRGYFSSITRSPKRQSVLALHRASQASACALRCCRSFPDSSTSLLEGGASFSPMVCTSGSSASISSCTSWR